MRVFVVLIYLDCKVQTSEKRYGGIRGCLKEADVLFVYVEGVMGWVGIFFNLDAGGRGQDTVKDSSTFVQGSQ